MKSNVHASFHIAKEKHGNLLIGNACFSQSPAFLEYHVIASAVKNWCLRNSIRQLTIGPRLDKYDVDGRAFLGSGKWRYVLGHVTLLCWASPVPNTHLGNLGLIKI